MPCAAAMALKVSTWCFKRRLSLTSDDLSSKRTMYLSVILFMNRLYCDSAVEQSVTDYIESSCRTCESFRMKARMKPMVGRHS
jgi:hypothetical protein